jgi:hypothetical protein
MGLAMSEKKEAFWRAPAMWLVLGLPLAAVIGSFVSLYFAIRSGSPDMVMDDVTRMSQVQTVDSAPDDRARELDLSFVAQVENDGVKLFPVKGELARDTPLQLMFIHPTIAEQDVTIELIPGEGGWHAGLANIATNHDWNVQVTPINGEWRVRGRLLKMERAVHLSPSIK